MVWADEAELGRLKARCTLSAGEINHTKWLEAHDSDPMAASY